MVGTLLIGLPLIVFFSLGQIASTSDCARNPPRADDEATG
jgi:hypothetical protein